MPTDIDGVAQTSAIIVDGNNPTTRANVVNTPGLDPLAVLSVDINGNALFNSNNYASWGDPESWGDDGLAMGNYFGGW